MLHHGVELFWECVLFLNRISFRIFPKIPKMFWLNRGHASVRFTSDMKNSFESLSHYLSNLPAAPLIFAIVACPGGFGHLCNQAIKRFFSKIFLFFFFHLDFFLLAMSHQIWWFILFSFFVVSGLCYRRLFCPLHFSDPH